MNILRTLLDFFDFFSLFTDSQIPKTCRGFQNNIKFIPKYCSQLCYGYQNYYYRS